MSSREISACACRNPCFHVLIAASCAVALRQAAYAQVQQPARPAISGNVQTKEGAPIAGAAVVIESVVPRDGLQLFHPICHPDCLFSAFTDDEGKFAISGVSDTMQYRLRIAKDSFESKAVNKVDTSRPVTVKLAPSRFSAQPGTKRFLRGQILGPHDRPVAAALVFPGGFMYNDRGEQGPMDDLATPQTTDKDGFFTIRAAKDVDSIDLEVRARDLVTEFFKDVPTRGVLQKRILDRGTAVTGRICRNEKPLAGIVVGAMWTERHSDTCSGPWEAMTDADGRFTISPITAEKEIFVYGKMSSLKEFGGVEAIKVTTHWGKSPYDLGTLPVVHAHELTGHVVLSDHKPLPRGAKLNVGRKGMFDNQSAELPSDGYFAIGGLPSGLYRLSVIIEDKAGGLEYFPSDINTSADVLAPGNLLGRIDDDMSLYVMMQPGEPVRKGMPNSEQELKDLRAQIDRLESTPLGGIPVGQGIPAPAK
jgi:Carboxypeptidase regulatory-like domain